MAVQLAKSAFGADRVVVSGRDTARLQWLRTVGADDAIVLVKGEVAYCGPVSELGDLQSRVLGGDGG